MQKVIDILDEMMEEHKKVLKNEWMCDYDIDNTIRSNILNEAKSRIQALWDWWISVTESPKDMELVAVWNNKWKKPMFAYFYKWKRWNYYRTATVDARIIEPTHWMPLPNSPK